MDTPQAPGYTARISNLPELRAARKGTNLMPRAWTDLLLAAPYALYCLLTLPPMHLLQLAAQKLSARPRSTLRNISTAAGGSATARIVLQARAYYAGFGLSPDTLATRLALSPHTHATPILRAAFAASYAVSSLGFALFRRDAPILLVNKRYVLCDMGTLLHARTCWLDDVVAAFAERHSGREANVVVLGAGYDSRAYRLASAVGARASWFEVDTSGTQVQKQRALQALGVDSGHVRFVPIDFAEGRWMEKLVAAGFVKTRPTCFVWEGVTMYLGREDIESTLRQVSECGAGSVIAFDYLPKTCVFDPVVQAVMASIGEEFRFGMAGESDVIDLIKGIDGLELEEWFDIDKARDRYLPMRANGSDVGRVRQNGGYVVAGCR